MELSEDDLRGFREREEGMWISSTRGDPDWMDEMLAAGFMEFGRSGRTFDRVTILAESVPDHIDCVIPLPGLEVRLLEPTVALVTYTSIVLGQASNRISVWRHDGDGWRLEFHQGTATATPVADQGVRDRLVSGIRGVEFGTKRKGYDRSQVDALIGSIADRVERGEVVTSADLRDPSFDVVPQGYTKKHVEGFLDGLGTRLDADAASS